MPYSLETLSNLTIVVKQTLFIFTRLTLNVLVYKYKNNRSGRIRRKFTDLL
jgi:hypothetical protein